MTSSRLFPERMLSSTRLGGGGGGGGGKEELPTIQCIITCEATGTVYVYKMLVQSVTKLWNGGVGPGFPRFWYLTPKLHIRMYGARAPPQLSLVSRTRLSGERFYVWPARLNCRLVLLVEWQNG